MRPVARDTYRNINSYRESSRRPFFYSSALNVNKKKDMCDRVDLFFCISRIFSGKNRTCADVQTFFCSSPIFSRKNKNICGRVDLFCCSLPIFNGKNRTSADVWTFFFALLINAAFGFKIFPNAAFRVNIIAHPCPLICPKDFLVNI